MNHLAPILLVMAGYVLTLVGMGLAFARYSASTNAMYRAENLVPWWIAGLSQFMASHSAYMFVIMGGMLYNHGGFGILWFALMSPVILLLCTVCFASRWHRTGVSTPVEYLEARFGPGVRQFYAWIGLVVRPLNNGVRMAAFGVIMAAIMGFGTREAVWIGLSAPAIIALAGMALVVTYTLLGGLMGAVVVDAVQFVIMETGLIALFGLSWRRSGGIGAILAGLPPHFLKLPPLGDPVWIWLAGWTVLQFADTGAAQWGLITRFLCTRTDRDARKAGYLTAALYVPIIVLMVVPVFAARAMHPNIDPEASFGWISERLLPPGLLALMIAAMFSATLATISAELNTLSGVFTLDVFKRRLRPDADERQTVRFGRMATAALGVLISVIALIVLGGGSTILRATQEISSVVVAPIAVSLLGGMFSSRSGARGVYYSVFLGAGVSAAVRLAGLHFGWSDRYMVLGQNGGAALVSIAVLWASGRILSTRSPQNPLASALFARMRTADSVRPGALGGFPAPLPLIGGGVLAMALVQGGTLLFPGGRDAWTACTAAGLGLTGLFLVVLGRYVRVAGQKS